MLFLPSAGGLSGQQAGVIFTIHSFYVPVVSNFFWALLVYVRLSVSIWNIITRTVLFSDTGNMVFVQWDNDDDEDIFQYNYGNHSKYSVLIVDEPRVPLPGQPIETGCVVTTGWHSFGKFKKKSASVCEYMQRSEHVCIFKWIWKKQVHCTYHHWNQSQKYECNVLTDMRTGSHSQPFLVA